MHGKDDAKARQAARTEAARTAIARMRTRLLDLSKRNALVSFKHSERSRNPIRIIAGSVSGIYDAVAGGRALKFVSLPPREDEPWDERTDKFMMALDAARLTDE